MVVLLNPISSLKTIQSDNHIKTDPKSQIRCQIHIEKYLN